MKKMMTARIHKRSYLLLLTIFLAGCGGNQISAGSPTQAASSQTTAAGGVEVLITGGHDTDPRDGGRPVVLIASALGVPAEVFREAFNHVHPAPAGQEPNPIQVSLNKNALLSVLSAYGVTNERLDEVSNYYRFNGRAGGTWPQRPAAATAILTEGVVTGFLVTDPGSGYTTPPQITVVNADVTAAAALSFTADFTTNGSLAAITLSPHEGGTK